MFKFMLDPNNFTKKITALWFFYSAQEEVRYNMDEVDIVGKLRTPRVITCSAYIECRLKLWEEGDVEGLPQEGRTIQQRLLKSPQIPRIEQQRARSFAKLMVEGKVRAALRLLSELEGGPPMALNEEVEINGNI